MLRAWVREARACAPCLLLLRRLELLYATRGDAAADPTSHADPVAAVREALAAAASQPASPASPSARRPSSGGASAVGASAVGAVLVVFSSRSLSEVPPAVRASFTRLIEVPPQPEQVAVYIVKATAARVGSWTGLDWIG